mmetsp:Transcript_47946/g.91660  ORF Transcript_47946/g.91660 Transcript_47946/m.91660 type:complete len:299 (+) Transcript_47946:123-1019(+)|eukprot:CAMPEP_0114249982 /NCGR_PEP_ID=MMETSP0058-20121206/14450_1 /TAXON_ID=36894 /ORGANISM="Pyramimonas parkeae, CCMP726" /LENGTH=298 /DNA_ID=CAMNT_0001363599 /DNA_START=121 /DNA_END=1017 /DNA_ORIENTATION=+
MGKSHASIHELRTLEEKINSGTITNGLAQHYMRLVRELKVRRSELVVKCGTVLLQSKRLSAEELWLTHEQLCIAALEVQDKETALMCIKKLCAKFPDSIRVGRLRGMALEMQGKWKEAATVYDHLLDRSPTNAPILKRKVAMERSQGNLKAAVELLNQYLATYMADTEAWAELADIYIESEMYVQAAFCMEELIATAPHNYVNHLRYAEVLYTQGGPENLRTARKYFAAAVELTNANCLRALYGLWACASAVATIKGQHRQPEDESDLLELSGKNLMELYKQRCPEKLVVVQKMVTGA